MIIRKPKFDEKDSIIKLLQASLGESLLKKTVDIWNFKHVENPFGESYVLVADEEESMIGVRALMQWRWQFQDQIRVSYRAVDTATHPEHQGKGIFTKLTLKALEDVRGDEESFVFNTPNDKSRPGYLKMGWQEVGKISVALVPVFFYVFRLFGKNKFDKNTITDDQLEKICENHNTGLRVKNVLFTPKSVSYLKWRYEVNPMQQYKVASTSDWYLAMYVKKHQYFNELRVAETLGVSDSKMCKQVQQAVLHYALKNKCVLISTADKDLFKLSFFGSYGPMLTFRTITVSALFKDLALNIKNWSYSLGDLELF
ncbi:MAG: GNAT family N-acetyltransferase [Flavobacterium sp.]